MARRAHPGIEGKAMAQQEKLAAQKTSEPAHWGEEFNDIMVSKLRCVMFSGNGHPKYEHLEPCI